MYVQNILCGNSKDTFEIWSAIYGEPTVCCDIYI